ncbi:MAG: hypothetical protein K9G49_14500 [Taibaiella sp.]|nr:hypothetical protein [Taibaiella sp.]
MNATVTLLEILKYTLPAIIVLLATTTIVKKFIFAENQRKQMAIFEGAQDVTLRLRLQAYERLAMFIERIGSRQLIPRLYDPEMTVRDLQIAITITIRTEFEHNVSQQIYVSKNVWETVKGVKEQELNMINRVAQSLNPEASAKELHARIMEIVSKTEQDLPTEVALQIINSEVKTVMQYGSY